MKIAWKSAADKKDMTHLAVVLSKSFDSMDLADAILYSNLTGHRIRKLIAEYGEAVGMEYVAGYYVESDSGPFGRRTPYRGGYTPAFVTLDRKTGRRVRAWTRKLIAKRKALE